MKEPSLIPSRIGLVIAMVAGSSVAVPTIAQTVDAAVEEPAGMGEIVVTAQGREQALSDVPISASVLGGDTVQQLNLNDLQAIGERAPAVKITPGPASDLLNIRGVGSGLNAGFEQSVGTFVDGVYRGRSRSSRAALFDIERVEILKGPQTTFFGNNAIAGALNITTRTAEPGDPLEYNASALYSPSDGQYDLEAGLSIPVTDDLAFRVAAKYFGMDGYVENPNLGMDGPNQEDFVARASLAWDATDNLRTDLRVDYGRFKDDYSFPNVIMGCPTDGTDYPVSAGLCAAYLARGGEARTGDDAWETAVGGPSDFELEYVEVALTNELDLDSHTLTSITSFFDHSLQTLIQLAPFPFGTIGDTTSPFPVEAPEDYQSFSQELRLTSSTGGTIEHMVGAYLAHGELETRQVTGLYFAPFGANAPGYTTAATPIARAIGQTQEDTTISAFASATFHATDSLRLNGGLRYSIVTKEGHRTYAVGMSGDRPATDFVALPLEAQNSLIAVIGGSFSDFDDTKITNRKFLPSFSIQYDIGYDLMGYASYSKGFKAGGFGLSTDGDQFGPETVDAYEVGLKGGLFGGRAQFSLAAFYSMYDDLQEATNVVLPSGITQFVVGNVAKAISKGVEFSLQGELTDQISFTGDIGYLDARYDEYSGAPCTILQTRAQPTNCTQDLSGTTRPYAPDFSGSVGLNGAFPVFGGAELRIAPSMNFTTAYYQQASIDELSRQEGFAKYDLRVGIGPMDRSWEIAVIGKNLSDERTGSFRNSIPTSPGSIYVLPDRPRSVAIQFSIKG